MSVVTLDIANKLIEQIRAEVLANQKTSMQGEASFQPRLLTVQQAGQYMARSEQAVRHLIFQRDIPVVRKGRCVRIDRKDLDRWIENTKS